MNPDFWRGKKVFLTGHTGFKGAWLGFWLTQMGAHVTGFSLAPVGDSLFSQCELDSVFQSVIGDIRDLDLVKKKMVEAQPDVVFHLAAQSLVRPSYEDPIYTYQVNVMGSAHILEAVRSVESVRSVVMVTTDKCYENKEWTWGYRENDPMGGYDPYSSSKGCAELMISSWVNSFFKKRSVGIASARAGNVFGGGDYCQDRLIPDCARGALADREILIRNPNSTRPWQFVLEPLAGYLILAERNFQMPFDFRGGWNFGPDSDQELTVKAVVDKFMHLWGRGARYRIDSGNHPHEANMLKLDCSKAKALLGWHPLLNFEQSLKMTVDWYQAEKSKKTLQALTEKQIHQYQSEFQSRKFNI